MSNRTSLPVPPTPIGGPPTLLRAVGLPLLVLYGLGTTIGGGIYVLIGAVVGRAGLYAPLSFVVAGLMVLFTALSFAELSSRFPKSAGEAVFVEEGLRSRRLAMLVGYLVILNGIVSSAALVGGFVGYFQVLVDTPYWLAVIGVTTLIGALACWGIGQSLIIAGVLTLVEIGGLVLIIWVGRDSFLHLPELTAALSPPLDIAVWTGIFSGAFLAFYAFIGFEDMVNVAEEVKNPQRTMPTAIILTLAITTLLYLVTALVVVSSAPLADLAGSTAPLQMVYQNRTGGSGEIISLISIVAVLNGVLIQVIMGSRVLYGMAAKGWSPALFARIHSVTRTPVIATLAVIAVTTLLALNFHLQDLAQATALIMLLISSLVNGALIRLKRRVGTPDHSFSLPLWVPVLGFFISVSFSVLVGIDLVDKFRGASI